MTEQDSTLRYKYDDNTCLSPILQQLGWSIFTKPVHNADNLPEHTHLDAFEICYITHGTVEWWVEGKTYDIPAGSLFITHPGEKHGGLNDIMNPCELFWAQIKLQPENIPGLAKHESSSLYHEFNSITKRVFPASTNVAFFFKCLIDEHRNPTEDSFIVTRASLIELLIATLRSQKTNEADFAANAPSSKEIRCACDFIKANLGKELNNEMIAGQAGLSVASLYQRFPVETGHTPREYITQHRIQKARMMLRNPDMSITDIAFTLGFSSSQYFSTTFKSVSGITPREYRAGIRSK